MIAALHANELGWVAGQMGPLIGWMDGLKSDAGSAAGLAQSLQGASTQLQSVGDEYVRRLADFDYMSGRTITAYAAHAAGVVDGVKVQGELAAAMAVGVQLASQLVSNVHGMVQDAVAEVAAVALAVKTQSVLTGDQLTPAAVARITTTTTAATMRVGPMVAGVVSALGVLGPLLRALVEAIKALFKGAGKGATKAKPKPGGGGAKPKSKDPKENKGAKDKSKDSTPIAKPPKVKDADLQNRLNQAYMREGNKPLKGGDGSLVDAIRYELRTGEKIGGSDHVDKGIRVRNSLVNWLKKNKDADPSDIETAQRVLQEIKDALDGN